MGKSKRGQGGYGVYLHQLRSLYQKKEVRLYTNLILSFGAIIALALFAIKPTVTTIAQIYKELKDQREVDERLQEKIDNLRRAREAYRQVEDKLYLINEALPTQPEPDLVVAQIERLAVVNNCSLTDIHFDNVTLKGNITSATKRKSETPAKPDQPVLKGDFQIKGEYADVIAFIEDLYILRRLNDVDKILLEGGPGRPLAAKVGITIYYLPPEE